MTAAHDHPHEHAFASAEAAPGPSTGAVVLDIGGNIGAAVVLTPPTMDELEIEIRPAGAEWDSTHVAVRKRLQPHRPEMYAAVFPALASGTYDLRVRFAPRDTTIHHIDVAGGQVTKTYWPDFSESALN
jgi:hypothetical protein